MSYINAIMELNGQLNFQHSFNEILCNISFLHSFSSYTVFDVNVSKSYILEHLFGHFWKIVVLICKILYHFHHSSVKKILCAILYIEKKVKSLPHYSKCERFVDDVLFEFFNFFRHESPTMSNNSSCLSSTGSAHCRSDFFKRNRLEQLWRDIWTKVSPTTTFQVTLAGLNFLQATSQLLMQGTFMSELYTAALYTTQWPLLRPIGELGCIMLPLYQILYWVVDLWGLQLKQQKLELPV